MVRLYHYSTWGGESINNNRVIYPSNKYGKWAQKTKLTEWPELTFLTTDPYWDQSIQTHNAEKHWEKCGSYPETYTALDIPCWRFEVNPNSLVLGDPVEFEADSKWLEMLEDAVLLGSDISKWRITVQDCYIINTWKWENDTWTPVN